MNAQDTWFQNLARSVWTPIVLLAAILGLYWALYPIEQPDYEKYLLPWLQALASSDGLTVFQTDFTNYTGGYITIFWLTSFAKGIVSDLMIIKGTAVLGTLFCALSVAAVLGAMGWDWRTRSVAALAFMALPSVAINGIAWGQADAYYAGFILLSFAALVRSHGLRGALFFCIAVSIKLQAIFFAPFILAYLIKTPLKIVWMTLMFPFVYLAINALFLVAGRPVTDVLTIYFNQSQAFHSLSLNAPNPWLMIQFILQSHVSQLQYRIIVLVGIAIASAVAAMLIVTVQRIKDISKTELLYWATVTLTVMPFVLPKMHERFFFLAEVFAFLLAIQVRKYLPIAMMFQITALLMYSDFQDTFGIRSVLGRPTVTILGFFCMSIALYMLIFRMRYQRPNSNSSSSSSSSSKTQSASA